MKTQTIKYIILFVCTACLTSGCIKNYDVPLKTEKGKQICDSWHEGIDITFQRYIDIVFSFNAWYDAPASQKDSIEDKYFPFYKIRNLGEDQWGLYYNASLAYRIDRKNKSLSELDAFWVVEVVNSAINLQEENNYGRYYSGYKFDSFINNEKTVIYISSIGLNEWNIQLQHTGLDMNIKPIDSVMPASLYDSPFVWTGKGSFTYLQYSSSIAYIHFETTDDIVCYPQGRKNLDEETEQGLYYTEYYPYQNSRFHWSAGKVSLNAFNSEKTDTVKVDASFSKLSSTHYGIYISYKGVTEEWIEGWEE